MKVHKHEQIILICDYIKIQFMAYWTIDATCFVSGLLYIFISLAEGAVGHAFVGTLWIWTYPIALETILNLWAKTQPLQCFEVKATSRFVYHSSYSMNLWGLEKNHPFDLQKYARVYQQIREKGLLPNRVIQPVSMTRSFLIEKMSLFYLFKQCYGFYISNILQIPIWWIPSWILRWRILDPMLRATEGSILAALAALQLGWAVNLSGGFHHASYGNGGGFCIYPDISLIVHYLQSRTLIRRIMIVDLDAHQGNGFERDLIINENVYIVDCYNSKIYPQDPEGKDAIMRTILIQPSTSNLEYLQRIDSLEQDFQFCQPEFVIYNAGTDILTGDPLGKLSMSRETVIKRDERVIEMSRSRGVPVVMLLSGGYQSTSGEIIGESLENLCRKFG